MSTRAYAEHTKVPIDRTLAEISRLVKSHGATNWTHTEDDESDPPMTRIQFKMESWVLRFTVDAPTLEEMSCSATGRYREPKVAAVYQEQETRRRWRELVLLLRAKLVAISSGVVSLEEEMLANIVLDDDQTVGDIVPGQLRALRASRVRQRSLALLPPAEITEES